MLPAEFIKRIKTQPYIDADSLVDALAEPSPVSIRINQAKWQKVPLRSEPVDWCTTGFYLESRPSYTLDPLFHAGCYYPQEASGMFIGEVLQQILTTNSGLRVLDLCAAPGGKSILAGDFLGRGSMLISNEVIRQRTSVLSETVAKWGSDNTIVTRNDAAAFSRLNGYFDLIMVDAPCSGEGMFRNRVAVDEWSTDNTIHCSERQKRILMDVWPSLKEGGFLIYSTCTFNPSENEENIKWLSEKKGAENIKLDIKNFSGIREIDYMGVCGYGFYPGMIKGEGLFISVIRKLETTQNARIKSQKKPEFMPSGNDVKMALKWFNADDNSFLKNGDDVLSIPCPMDEYLFLYGNLNVARGGTGLFMVKKNDYLPVHELALSRHMRKDAFPSAEIDLKNAIAFLKKETGISADLQEGWNVLTYRDKPLGFVKNIGKRINNYYPVEWRIRMDIPEQGKENLIVWKE